MKLKYRKFFLLLVPIVGFGLWAYYPNIITNHSGLVFKIEGALDSKLNFRDAGLSINECAARKLLPEGKIYRASGFFSGWSCDRVGNPDVIFSLNGSIASNRQSYCRSPEGLKIGVKFQQEELNDLEFLTSWTSRPEMVNAVCQFLKAEITNLANDKSSLFHCDAGRDRTGAVIALLAAYQLEMDGNLSDEEISAIECDYRKSQSLDAEKYGRIHNFLYAIRSQNGVRKFLASKCCSAESNCVFNSDH
jgi:hypothetical protein